MQFLFELKLLSKQLYKSILIAPSDVSIVSNTKVKTQVNLVSWELREYDYRAKYKDIRVS